MDKDIKAVVKSYKSQRVRLIDMLWEIQEKYNYISDDHIKVLAKELSISTSEVIDTLSFYHFFHRKPAGKFQIYVDCSAVCEIFGANELIELFENELHCKLNETDKTATYGLYKTSCIGMADQAPAVLINGIPYGGLNKEKALALIASLKKKQCPSYKVKQNIRVLGEVFSVPAKLSLTKLTGFSQLKAQDIIELVKDSGLRGRGGAGFATGKKWQLCRAAKGSNKVVVCNADEGEPGTFKDRFLLSNKSYLVFEGMLLAARAIGAKQGFLYLRGEYRYLKPQLEAVLNELRQQGFLANNADDAMATDFDIEIRLGAGAYVVGEESALLESLEGKRGEPRIRPPFPVDYGYLNRPTVVNNVETFAAVSRICEKGSEWFRSMGTPGSKGTKLLSVSGDCARPGIYEVEWGLCIAELLELVGAKEAYALQIGGPSGLCISAEEKHRQIAFEDLATGGSIMIFNKERNILNIVKNFMNFFAEESCGCCAPCRAGGIVLNEQLDYLMTGQAAQLDLKRIEQWSNMVATSSRCGLGQTCPNPILSSMKAFPQLYKNKVLDEEAQFRTFNLGEKLKPYDELVAEYESKHNH